MTKSTDKKTLTANDWLDEALQVVAENGLKALAIEPLARRMKVSKGSFYWHFKNRKELLLALLEFWQGIEDSYQQQLEQQAQNPKDLLLNSLTLLIEDDTNKRIFLALSSDLSEPAVQQTYQQAVNRRLELFTEIFTNLNSKQAEQQALLTFNFYLGTIKLLHEIPEQITNTTEISELINDFVQRVIK